MLEIFQAVVLTLWLCCQVHAFSEYEFNVISSGADYTLAVQTDGTPLSWGFPFSERGKVYVPLGYLWTYMRAGISHSCGITNASETICWGRQREGQCDVPAGYSFLQLTLGKAHTCGITDGAELLCWGTPIDETLAVPPGNTWSQVDAGTVSTCGVNSTGTILCWGKQGYDRKAVPYGDNADVTWQEVACGDRHCCGLLEQSAVQALNRRQEDNVICWGDDSNAQLQVPGKEQARTGTQETFTSISAGNYHTCGVTLGMDVWCWGRVDQYGLNFQTPGNATMLSSGGIHACVLDNKKAKCWGGNTVGQATVPVDAATYPPSIMEFANDPFDIMEEDQSVRLTPYIAGYTEPKRTYQHIMMAILFPEFALTDSPLLTFEHIDGTEDPYSPHIIKFPESWNAPTINQLQVSALDLTLWYDIRLGASPAIRNITSTWVNGTTEHRLVDGGAYSVRLQYQDTFNHPVATHWIQRYEVTYDLETLAPTLWSPTTGEVKQGITVGYYLEEDMNPDDVWIIMTFTGPSTGQQAQDTNSPYQIQLEKAVTYKGNHSFQLVLGNLYELLDGRPSPYVRQVLTANGVGGNGTSLVSGGNYDMVLRVSDSFFNAAKSVQVSGLDFIWDVATETVQRLQPVQVVNDPIIIEYTLPEPVLSGSLRFVLTWIQNTNESTAQADVQSPHTWWVSASKERDVTVGATSNILRLSASNLFRDPDNEALPHPDITKFESRGTPVYSTLQPFSEYVLTISYQDIFGNPRSTLNVTLPTNFTPPGAPSAPTMRSRTTTSLEIGWTRGETGGLRITKYDLQLFAAPDPPLWWNGTNQEAADYAANGVGNVLQDQEVVGQESNQATFRNLNSSHHYVVRLRAWSKSGVSDWSSWSILRVLSACSDGLPHDGEACDDGNMLDGDGCSSNCVVEMGWTCEAQPAGNYADGWGRGRSRCIAAGMDGLRVGSEECDDCNLQAGDGCDNGKVEPGHICIYQGRLGIETGCPGVLAADTNNYLTFTADDCRIPCGDGIRHIVAGEECDDGNIINGDGCTSDCRIETGYTCHTVGWPQVLLTPCRAICGDGLRLGEEECDDNNTVAGDGCGPDCKVELGWFCKRKPDDTGEVCLNTCLNGNIDPGEECDDANTFSDDGCANCIVEPGWSCEVIANRQTSTSAGSFCVPVCGDGFRIESGPMAEQCDDGNNLAGDGCDPSCRIETGWTCVSQASEVNTTALRCEPVCGDGLLVVGEGCDDGNKDSGDGCSASCQVERGFVCSPEDYLTKSEVATGPPFAAQNRTICMPICGDGLVLLTFGEACDDGNRVPGDGCDENCAIEPGYTCGSGGVSSSSVCSPICGDGLLRAPEQCDDGNTGKGDGCNEQCQFEQGYQCWPPGAPCRFLCGDSLRLEGEACDDGNLALEDGCDSTCQVEDGWSCSSYIYGATNTTSVCSPICGDGKIRGAEACDDGNLLQGDGCDENCSVEAGWICCDPAPGTTGSRCSVGLPVDRDSICGVTCGNGQRDNGEACDDGNLIAADGCSPGCEVEAGFVCMPMGQQRPGRKIPDFCEAICGDGLLVVGEECDDGNQVSGDGCGPTCKIEQSGTACPPLSDLNGAVCRPTCGDGIRGPGEECDDANSFSGDGCSKDCLVERGFFCSGGGMRSRDTCWPICGDGLRVDRAFSATLAADKLEGCDTGSIQSRGCDAATCQIRPGWTCARPSGPGAEVCTPVCGDGIVISPMEECDDSNNLPGDGCSPDCKVEALYECSYSSFHLRSVCQIRCGDGRKHPSEACDDGNNWDQDGCSSDCQLEPGFECLGGTLASPSECKPICGDGFEVHGEGCDDGNLVPWDGCNQFCQVEEGYHCTRAPSPGGQGVVECSKSCGDGVQNYNEECDDAGSSSSCFQCRKLPETVCGDFRRTDNEECDDGNTASGDGCSSSCTLEPGWTCAKGPSHLSPGTAPGDVCTPVCGDGLVVTGEACDDGNSRGDDGCTGDCQVEPLYDCFLPGAIELLQVPASERPSNGPAASICVRTTPPRLQGARFDESFVTLELQFDSRVAPLPGEEYSGGVALAATSFSCSVLVDQNTLRLLGQGPRCWWKSRQVAAIALGSAPGLVPGSAVTLQAGVLRRYVFSQVTAPSQELKADVAGGTTAPVLWPRPVIWGPQIVPSCADSTTLNSDNSQGLAGRMALPSRWYVAGAFNITNGSWDSEELTRIEAGIVANAQEPQVIFPRQGVLLSLVDLEYDRSLRVNYLYRICLQQENVLGLVGVSCHHLEVEELPVPIVEPLVPPGPYTLPRYGRWLNLELEAAVPKGCVLGDAPMPTTFLSGQAPEPSHSLTLEEPLRPLQAAWSYDAAVRTVYQQQALAVTAVADAQSLGQDKTGSRSVDSRLSVEPGTFSAGFVNVHAGACINASKNLTENEISLGMLPLEEVCGYYTFVINVQDLPAQPLSSVSSSRRASAVADQLLAAAAAAANLRLVGLAPSPGAAPEGPPLQAEEGKTPVALQRLDVLEDPQGNSRRAELLQFGWLGAVEPENDTTIIGAIPLAPVGNNEFTQAELQAGLATLTPVVSWSVQAETRTGTQVATEPSVPSVGGAFLSIPPQQLSPGSQVQVTAHLDLLPPNAGTSCTAPLRSMSQQATLTVGLPPASGYVLLDRSQVVAPARFESFVLESMRWSSQVLPLQYRMEAEFSTGQRVLLNDWSYDPKLSVVLLPRAETVQVRGQVRDGRGVFSVTAPETINLLSKAGAEDLRVLTEFQQGRMSLATYSVRRVSETLKTLESEVLAMDPALQLQLWQDVAFAALSGSFNGTLTNCTEDCGPQGQCPSLDTAPRSCDCSSGWLGTLCEIQIFEVASQELITRKVLVALQQLLSTHLEVLGITSRKGAFARVFKLLQQVGADCRRLPADVMASLTALAAGLAVLVPKVALRDASAEMADLMSQLYICLPEEPAEPMANMPAPATVLLTSLGSSQICRTVGTATTLCYDLASSDVTLSCNISASQAGALVESHCRVDLNLGLSDPYPCPCPVPNDPWLGFGRSGEEAPLSETLGARSEKDILWRELLKRFWNSTAYTSNLSAAGPALAAALWLQEIGAPDSQVTAALAKAEQTQLIQQGVLLVLKNLAQLLADALLMAAVPGQAPSAVSSLPVVAHWDMPTVVPGAEAGKSRNGTAVLFVDTAGTTVEVELESSYQLVSTWQLPSILPFKVPMGALHWNYAGRGLFSQMDPSIKVHSDVVQLRLLESQQFNLTKLRYRFMVPENQPSCSQQRPAEDLLLLCCNASNDTTRPGTFASLSCPTSPSGVQARRVAESPRVLTLRAPDAPETQAGSVIEIVGKQAPFEQGLESLLDDTRFWTPTGQTVLLAGTHIRLRGGDLKVARACDSQGNAAPRLILKEGQMLQEPEDSYYADAWCRTVFSLARAKRSSAQSWQTFANLLLEAAEEVLADPSVVPTSTTATVSSSTRTTSTSTSSTKSSVSTTTSATYTSSSTITITSTGIMNSSTSTSVSVTHTSSSTSISFTSSITGSTSSTTEAFNGTTTMTLSTTTPPWCTRADVDPAQKDTWCPSGVDSETALPFYADVELSDTEGVLLVDVFSVQFSLNGSSPLAFRSTGAGRLILLVPERSTFFVWAMSEIFSLWVSSWQELHKVSNSSVLRDWLTTTSTATISTTMTSTSATATISTTTRLVKQFPTPLHSSGLLLGALELAFSDPLEVFSRALAFDLENYNGVAARDVVDSLWADRGLEGGNLLSTWCQVPKLAPAQNLSRIFLALDPALKFVDDTGLRPLHSVLEALDRGVPSWWNESFWADSAGGPDWVAPLPTTSTMTRTTTSTQDLEALLCPEVDCLPTGDCGLDPSDLECVAWSESLRRFIPALGCTLIAEPGRRWPLLQSGHFELLCECESWAHHSAMAIAEKRPEMTPFPPQVTIRTREYVVSWYDKVNRYNLRGLAIVFAFIVLALLHLAVAAYAEVRWRMQARWVAMHASRMKGVQVEVKQLDNMEKDFIKRRAEEIRAQGELSAAVVAAEAEAALLQAQSLQQSPMTNTLSSLTNASLDFRHAKDGLATIFQAQGLGDVEDDVVRPAMSHPGPVTPTVSTHIVTSSLKKEAPSIAAVPPPLASGAPSPQTLSLREAAHEEAFQPEAMILVKQPLKERVVNYLHDAAVVASQRCTRKNVWRNCQIHHKIVSLSDDSQTWSFSAPERAAVFHFSLWIQAVSLALVLGGGVDRRPYQDPFCPGAGNEFTLAAAGCLLQASQLLDVMQAALYAVLVSAVVQTICRGRSFAVRTQELTAAARERAFTRHFLGPWPSVIMAPQEAKARVWNLFCGLTATICCCSCCPRLKRRPLLPLHWQPSVVPICAALLLFVLAWALAYYMFFFSSSIYMYEVSRTDTTEVDILYPPDERSEVAAAEIVGPLQAHLILVPEMQRFLALLILTWMMTFFVFEPLLLALHLLCGEPTLDDLLDIIWKLFMVQVRFVSWLCGLCIPQKRRDQASKFLTDSSQRLTKSLSGLAPPAKPAGKICCCRRRSKVVPLAPEDLKETIESEGEEEKVSQEKGHTPKKVEAKEIKRTDGDGAKERDSSKENQEDKEEKRKKEKRKKRKP